MNYFCSVTVMQTSFQTAHSPFTLTSFHRSVNMRSANNAAAQRSPDRKQKQCVPCGRAARRCQSVTSLPTTCLHWRYFHVNPGMISAGRQDDIDVSVVPDGSTAALEQTVCFWKDNLLGDSFLQLGHLHINFSWRSLLLYPSFFSPFLILPV